MIVFKRFYLWANFLIKSILILLLKVVCCPRCYFHFLVITDTVILYVPQLNMLMTLHWLVWLVWFLWMMNLPIVKRSIILLTGSRIKQDSSLKNKLYLQVDTHMVLPQTKYILTTHHAMPQVDTHMVLPQIKYIYW